MLESIPTYRIILNPNSFLVENNIGKSLIEMACELPNSHNIHRKQEMRFLPVERHKWYYKSQLLLEIKRFCREMLHNCTIDSEPYESILKGNNWNELIRLIDNNQVIFFKYLIINDLEKFRLFKGHLKEDIDKANTIKEINLHLRKYAGNKII